MKKLLMIALSLVLLASCGTEKTDGDNSKEGQNKEVRQEPDGDHVITSYANGNPKLVKTFEIKGEKLVAVYEKEYYNDGALLKEGKLKDGKRDGLWKSFRRDGILWSDGNYKNGLRNGITTTYHPNGEVYYMGEYTDRKKSGNWKFYNEQGKLVKEEDF